MKGLNRFAIGFIVLTIMTVVVLSVVYPEQFSIMLAGVVLGFIGGSVVTYSIIMNLTDKVSTMTQEAQKKVLTNPASIMREARLANDPQANKTPQSSNQQEIPRFEVTGL